VTTHKKIFRANEAYIPWDQLMPVLHTMRQAILAEDYNTIRRALIETVQGYKPSGGIVDLLYAKDELEVS
jgi:UDP-N-acetylglucosamine 4,6-dehydratase